MACHFELNACEFQQVSGTPWRVRVLLDGSATLALCTKRMPPGATFCEPSQTFCEPSQNVTASPPRPEPVSFMLEHADDAVTGPDPLVEDEWLEHPTRSAAVARVGFRGHTLRHHCGQHVDLNTLWQLHFGLDDDALVQRRAGGSVTFRIPTSAGLVVVEVGPAASFQEAAAPRARAEPAEWDLRPPHDTDDGHGRMDPWRLSPGLHSPLLPGGAPARHEAHGWLSFVALLARRWSQWKSWWVKTGMKTSAPAVTDHGMRVAKFFHEASVAPAGVDSDVTLCTQLDTLGPACLVRLAEQWGGPRSVALHLMPWHAKEGVMAKLLADPMHAPVLEHADLHVVEATWTRRSSRSTCCGTWPSTRRGHTTSGSWKGTCSCPPGCGCD